MASILPRKTSLGIVYHARVRIQGAPPQSSVHKRRTDAVKWAQSVEVAVRERRYFPSSVALRHTLADAIDRYLKDLPLRALRDERNRRRHLAWWHTELGGTLLSDLTPDSIGQARDKLARPFPPPSTKAGNKKARAPATVNRYLAALSHVLSVARKEWRWIARSPMADVQKAREPGGRVRYLSREELARLREACRLSPNTALDLVVLLALTTAMRKGEILNLRWRDVDLEQGHATVQQAKNGERRTVPLIVQTWEILQSRKPDPAQLTPATLVFPGRQVHRPACVAHAWKNAVRQAKIEDFRFHDLRHTAASYLAMTGCTSLEIAEVLGHKTLQMVKRYSHLSTEHTRRSLERLGAAVLEGGAIPNTSS